MHIFKLGVNNLYNQSWTNKDAVTLGIALALHEFEESRPYDILKILHAGICESTHISKKALEEYLELARDAASVKNISINLNTGNDFNGMTQVQSLYPEIVIDTLNSYGPIVRTTKKEMCILIENVLRSDNAC